MGKICPSTGGLHKSFVLFRRKKFSKPKNAFYAEQIVYLRTSVDDAEDSVCRDCGIGVPTFPIFS